MIPESLMNLEPDYTLSPKTGWTRRHWLAVLEAMLLGVLRTFDSGHTWPQIPPSEDGDALANQLINPGGPSEKLNRTMMLAATYMAATGKTTIDGFDGDIAEIYRRGLIDSFSLPFHKRNPKSPYNRCSPAAHISMLLAWEYLYEPMSQAQKNQLGDYLRDYVKHFPNESNLLLFSMTPGIVLQRMGQSYDRGVSEGMFSRIMNMYRGDGWFIDGWNQQFDSYNFWGFQLYLHLFMCFDEKWRSQYGPAIAEITARHEKTLPYWFAADGGPVPKGRSMNYRFATLSGIQWSQKSGLNGMSPGLARRISSGCLKYFVQTHSCLRDDLILPIGYWGENTAIGEDYTDVGAPYWSATGLVALTLPQEHPFWTDTEEESPADSDQETRIAVRGARMTIKTGGPRGESRAYVAGEPFRHCHIWQSGSKFYQHAYSSSLGYALAGDQGPELSAGRTGLSDDGENWLYRTQPRIRFIDADHCASEWSAWQAADGVEGLVVTESFFLDAGELHVFTHHSKRPRYMRIGGWAVKLGLQESPQISDEDGLFTACSDFNRSQMLQVSTGENSLEGTIECITLEPRAGFSHSHLFGGRSCWPQWTSAAPIAPGEKVAVFVDAARCESEPQAGQPDIARLVELAQSADLTAI